MSAPATMRAALVAQGGGVEVVDDRPVPRPREGEVLVRVRAAALNRADLFLLAGQKHGALGGAGTPMGMEFAGEVAEVGAGVTGLAPGDRVMGSGAGTYAEYAVADAGRVLPLPRPGMGFDEAATLPVALQTMHDAVITHGALQPGETILVQGASSGVGLMALQIARWRGASVVIGSSTNADRRGGLGAFGAHHAVDSSDPEWPEQVRAMTGGKGVEVIVDQLSGTAANGNLKAAAVLGRIVNVGRLAGMRGDFDFDLHALKRIRYEGVTFRTRTPAEVREIVRLMREDLWPALADGTIALPIAARFPLAGIGEAFAMMSGNLHFGKIVVMVE